MERPLLKGGMSLRHPDILYVFLMVEMLAAPARFPIVRGYL